MKKKIFVLMATIMTLTCFTACTPMDIINQSTATNSSQSEDYILPSDNSVITELDLSKLNETELRYGYAEIFARHGKIFDDTNLSRYFTSKDWYVPNPKYSDMDLSSTEKGNADFISKYIKDNYETTTETTTQAPVQKETVIVEKEYIIQTPQKNTYSYDYIIPDSSVRKLTKSELSAYDKETLAYIRNEIYARNGYIFQKDKYRNYFGSKSWYVPNANFNESWLNSTEKYNIKLIKSME